MTLTKVVNGVTVELSAQEEADVRARWAEAEAASWLSNKTAEITVWMDQREKMFSRLNNIERRLAAAGDTAGAASCVTVSTSLLGLFTAPAVTGATTMPALTAALKASYTEAVALATASARAEFKKYDK